MNMQSGSTHDGASDLPLDPQALARRRLLLKSVGKGSALVVAASPLASYAAPRLVQTPGGTQCTVSGFKSSVASRVPSTVPACAGYKANHYVNRGVSPTQPSGWPTLTGLPSGATQLKDILVSDLFPGVGGALTVFEELDQRPTSTLSLFIAAYFAAALTLQGAGVPGQSGLPYTTADVVSQYNNGAPLPAVVEFYMLVLIVD